MIKGYGKRLFCFYGGIKQKDNQRIYENKRERRCGISIV
jgi:hypothetical protein